VCRSFSLHSCKFLASQQTPHHHSPLVELIWNATQLASRHMTHTVTCSALLFDLDGVLIDSTPAVERVWRNWAIQRGFDPDEVVHNAHGRPSIATIRDYLPNADHEAENRKVEAAEVEDLEGVVALPGVVSFLNSLPPDRWTIITSCTRKLAEVRIRAARIPTPTRMITADEIVHGKPHPEPYLKGAELLGFGPAECIVCEDVPAGIRAGKTASMKVIAMETTLPREQLLAAGADWIIPGCSHLENKGDRNRSIRLTINT
jgi:sugar-phosphatase